MKPTMGRAMLAGMLGITLGSSAHAEDRVLRIEGVGGAFQQLMNSDVIPTFIEKYHIRAEYSGGNPTDQIGANGRRAGKSPVGCLHHR